MTIGIIAAVVMTCMSVSSHTRWEDGSKSRLSDYLFMEAQRQSALDNPSDYFEILNRAYQLDPSQTAIGHDLGYLYMVMADNDTTLFNKGYDMMRRHFNAHPDDYYSSMFYGTINDRLRDGRESLRVWSILDSLFPHKIDVTYKLAEALAGVGDTASLLRSIDVYNRIEVAEGKDIGVISRKIRSYYALGDTASILSEVHSLFSESPKSVEYNIYAGDIFQILNNRDSALHYLNRALELDSTNGVARFKRANIFRAMGDSVRFDREVFDAVTRNDLELDMKLELFRSYIQELYGDSVQAPRITRLFNILQEQYPHEVDVRDLYTAYLLASNDIAGGAEQLSHAVDIDPSDPQRWLSLIGLYFQTDAYDKAIATAERAAHYHPSSPDIWVAAATAYTLDSQYDKAIQYYDKALAKTDSAEYSKQSAILGGIADAFHAMGNSDSAYVYYEKALELDPSNLMSMNNCAYYMAVEGTHLDRAEQLSAMAVRNDPKNSTYLDTYAWVLFKKKNYDMARQYIDSAIQYFDGELSDEILEHAGDIYFMDGHPAEALEFWRLALNLKPDNELLQRKVKHKTYFYK